MRVPDKRKLRQKATGLKKLLFDWYMTGVCREENNGWVYHLNPTISRIRFKIFHVTTPSNRIRINWDWNLDHLLIIQSRGKCMHVNMKSDSWTRFPVCECVGIIAWWHRCTHILFKSSISTKVPKITTDEFCICAYFTIQHTFVLILPYLKKGQISGDIQQSKTLKRSRKDTSTTDIK